MNEPPETELFAEDSEPEPRKPGFWLYILVGIPLGLLAVVLLTRGGHRAPDDRVDLDLNERRRDQLFDYAIDSFHRQEEFDTPEMIKNAMGQLDGWAREQTPLSNWQADPMLDTLPEPFANLPALANLDQLAFTLEAPNRDDQTLREAIWLRDLSRWARGEEVGDLPHAMRLFDWTIRNIQLSPQEAVRVTPSNRAGANQDDNDADADVDGSTNGSTDSQPTEPDEVQTEPNTLVIPVLQKPWETLLLGNGTAWDRAWVFILLARQQGLDAVLIGPAEGDSPEMQEAAARLVGVFTDNRIYLFDPKLGIPIPAADGISRDDAGRLVIRPATLSEVVADDSLLVQLDVDAEHPYPLRAKSLDGAIAWLEASPSSVSQRMKLVEGRLVGPDRMILTTDPTAQAARIKKCPRIGEVRLWTFPYQTALLETQFRTVREAWQSNVLMRFILGLDEPKTLWKGRSYHLKGQIEDARGATAYYQMARLSDRQLAAPGMEPDTREFLRQAKRDATYWLGLLQADQGNVRAAVDYLNTRTRMNNYDPRWLYGATYNLARIFETEAPEDAIQLYRQFPNAPNAYGNLLRARWLESLADTGPKVKEDLPTDDEPGNKKPAEPSDEKPAEPGDTKSAEKPEKIETTETAKDKSPEMPDEEPAQDEPLNPTPKGEAPPHKETGDDSLEAESFPSDG